jgi:photosystem II stability/assembly factor-like uncharacterized protein
MKKYITILILTFLSLLLNYESSYAQWSYAGPDGGFISNIEADGDDIYAISGRLWFTGQGIYKSTDSGNTWEFIYSDIPSDVRDLIVKDGMLFIGTGSGVYRSEDGGLTWIQKNTGLPSENWINHLVACGNVIFAAGTSNGMMISTDNGEHWKTSVNGLTDTYIYSLTANENMVFAGTGDQMQGVFRSDDFGLTWQQVVTGMAYYQNGNWLPGFYPTITALGFVGNTLYAGTGESQGIWKSVDMGENWSFTSLETMNYEQFTTISGVGETVLAGTLAGTGMIRSQNEGANWSECNNGIDNYGIMSDILILENEILTSTQGGIYRTSNNGNEWAFSGTGLRGFSSSNPGFIIKDNYLFWGTATGGIFRSADEGNSWNAMNNGLPVSSWNLDAIYSTPSALFAWDRASLDNGETWQLSNTLSPGTAVSDYYGPRWIESGDYWFAISNSDPGVWRSSDEGQNWINTSNGIPNPANTSYFEITELGSTLIVTTSVGLFYSTDEGSSWHKGNFPDLNYHIFSGASFIANDSVFICGLYGGGGRRGIYRSADKGKSWNEVSTLLVRRLFTNGNKLYATGTNLEMVNNEWIDVPRIFMSDNQGVSWSNISQDLSDINSVSFAVHDSYIFIVTTSSQESSVYCSVNDGDNWTEIKDGLPASTIVSNMCVLNNNLFAGTQGLSVWKRALSDFSPPVMPDTIAGPLNPCSGQEVNYSTNEIPGVTYSWQVPSDWTIESGNGTGSITVIAGSEGGLILVAPSNGFGTGPSQYIMVNPFSSVDVTVLISEDHNNICEGDIMEFTSTASNEGNQPVYSWLVNGMITGENAPSFSYIPADGDIISLLLTSSIECASQSTVLSNEITAVVNSLPVVIWEELNTDTLCINASAIELMGASPEGGIYSGNGVTNNSSDSYIFNPSVAGDGNHELIYTYVDNNGCAAQASNQVTVNLCTGMAENSSIMSIYPNPAGDLLNIFMTGNTEVKEVYIFNSMGIEALRYNTINPSVKITLSLSNLPAGSYILKVVTTSDSFVRTIIKK